MKAGGRGGRESYSKQSSCALLYKGKALELVMDDLRSYKRVRFHPEVLETKADSRSDCPFNSTKLKEINGIHVNNKRKGTMSGPKLVSE